MLNVVIHKVTARP